MAAGLESSLREGTELKEEEKAWRGRPGNLHWVNLGSSVLLDPACQHTHDLQVLPLFSFPMAPFLSHQTCLVQAEAQSGNRKQTVWCDRESSGMVETYRRKRLTLRDGVAGEGFRKLTTTRKPFKDGQEILRRLEMTEQDQQKDVTRHRGVQGTACTPSWLGDSKYSGRVVLAEGVMEP